MKKAAICVVASLPVALVVIFAALNPPSAHAVPSYARQTGLACSGCHYTPPELNPAGRQFKLLGYIDKQPEKAMKDEAGKHHAALDILASLPLSAMFEASYTNLQQPIPTTKNGNAEFPQDISLFLAGAWSTHVGSFAQITYDTQNDHFSVDNTDIRYANTKTFSGKQLVYGIDMNNNPTVEDLWNSTPAWGFPWISNDFAPTPTAEAIINGALAQDVAGVGGYGMWNNHLYVDAAVYASDHVGISQPNPGVNFAYNISGAAPYWRAAWQQATATTQFEVGTYGIHMSTTPGAIVGVKDEYTDWAVDGQVDHTLFRRDVLSFRGTYIGEHSSLFATTPLTPKHHLDTGMLNAEYHVGNRFSATGGFFDTWGTIDPTLYTQSAITGSANGDPRSTGYIANLSFWPVQNIQLAFQYTGYTRFNGGSTDYDGAGRNATGNNTTYLLVRFIF
jgi:hypothetical protein